MVSGRSRIPGFIEPMLAASDRGRLPDDPRYAYEFKWDGYRAIMRVAADGTGALTSRNNNDFTGRFPQLSGVLADVLGGRRAVLDGEIVALDERGRPDFSLLQNAARRPAAVAYFVFDLLQLGDDLLLRSSYDERRAILEGLEIPAGLAAAMTPAYSHADLSAQGMTPHDLLDVAADTSLEGLVCKLRAAPYTPGRRSPAWLKHPLVRTAEVVLCGWRPGQGRLDGTLGGLLLGAHDPATGDLVYVGDVGTGWSDAARADLAQRLATLEQSHSPFARPIPRADAARARWVRPVLVGDVVYRQFTPDGRLRHTAWRGERPDRDAADVRTPEPTRGR